MADESTLCLRRQPSPACRSRGASDAVHGFLKWHVVFLPGNKPQSGNSGGRPASRQRRDDLAGSVPHLISRPVGPLSNGRFISTSRRVRRTAGLPRLMKKWHVSRYYTATGFKSNICFPSVFLADRRGRRRIVGTVKRFLTFVRRVGKNPVLRFVYCGRWSCEIMFYGQ